MVRSLIFLMVSLLAGGIGLAEDVSPCSVDLVPIQIVRGTVRDDVGTISTVKIYNFPPGFITFVESVTEHLVAKLNQEQLCLSSAASKESSLIQFVSWPFISNSFASPPFGAQSSGVCRITSPWADIVIEREPVPLVRAIFRYSERQLLADQAVLSGARNVPSGVAMPLSYEEFNRYADLEYALSEILGKPAKKPIEERVPPDLLWLFRNAWQDTEYGLFSGSAGSSVRKAMKMSSESYTQIVTSLIDRCFESESGADIQFNSILDIDDMALLEQYKIVTPIIVIPDH